MSAIESKIKKLLELSRSDNPHEAAAAAARAQELMLKYAVDEEALRAAGQGEAAEPVVTIPLRRGTTKIPSWEPTLCAHLARSMTCRVFYTKGVDIYVVGRKSMAEAVIATFYHLRGEIVRMAEKGWDAAKGTIPGLHGRTWKRSFYNGANSTIHLRLDDAKRKLVADTSGMAIVLFNREKEVDDFMKSNFKLRSSHDNRWATNAHGYQSGQKAGWGLNLNAQTTKQLGSGS